MTELLQPNPEVRERPGGFPGRATPLARSTAGALPLPPAAGIPRGEPIAERALALARSWLRRHAVSLPIVAGLLVLAGVLIGTGISHYPGFGDDEGTYTAEAWAVMTHGSLSHYTYWYDHPPLGWIQLGLLTWLLGGLFHGVTAVATARSLMLIPALATVALTYVLARRLGLRRGFAALAGLLLVASPLGLTSLREVYLEDFALPWLIGAFALAATPTRRLWAFAASGACFALAVLSKETMLLFAPGLVLLAVQRADRRTRSFCLAAFGAAFLLLLFGYPLYATLKGELLPGAGHVSLEQAIVWQLSGRQGSGSILSGGSAASRTVSGWTAVDPWLLALGVAAVPVALFLTRLRAVAVAVACSILVAMHGGYLPEPFDIGLLPFLGLLIAGVADLAWGSPGWPIRATRTGREWLDVARREWMRPIAVGAALVTLAGFFLPVWVQGDSHAMSSDSTASIVQAEHYVERHISRRARLMIDDTMYVDLVRAGFRPRYGVVWFYKLGFGNNLDPAIVRHLPRGWREFDYVISTPVLRSALSQDGNGYTQVKDALSHSRPVASFGSASQRIQVRRISGAGSGFRHTATAGGAAG